MTRDAPRGDAAGDAVRDNRPDFAGDSWPDGWDHDPFSRPSDFDRSACSRSGFAAWKPEGVWTTRAAHVGTVMLRFARDAVAGFEEAAPQDEAGGLRGWVSGRALGRIIWNDGTLFWSRTTDAMAGEHRVTAFLACRLLGPESIEGLVARCVDGVCDQGTYTALKLGWNAGEVEAKGLEKVAEYGGMWEPGLTVNVRVTGGRAYLARYQDGLRILDVSRAATEGVVTELGHVPSGARNDIWNDVKVVANRWALMASSRRGMVVVDAQDPKAPVVAVDMFPEMARNVHSIFLEGTTAYLADTTFGGVLVVDVSDPASPRQIGQFNIGKAFVHDLYVDRGMAYLNYWNEGMVVVDMKDPAAPREIGRFTYQDATSHASWKTSAGGRTFVVHGDESWAAHIRVVDVDPASAAFLTEIGSFKIRDHVSVHNLICAGSKCYVAYYQDGVRVLDVSNPTLPRQTAYFNTFTGATGGKSFFEGAIGIDVVGGLIYAADSERGLVVLREK